MRYVRESGPLLRAVHRGALFLTSQHAGGIDAGTMEEAICPIDAPPSSRAIDREVPLLCRINFQRERTNGGLYLEDITEGGDAVSSRATLPRSLQN